VNDDPFSSALCGNFFVCSFEGVPVSFVHLGFYESGLTFKVAVIVVVYLYQALGPRCCVIKLSHIRGRRWGIRSARFYRV